MAQPGQDTVQAPNQLATIQALLGLLSGGGQTTTTNPGDISYLQQLFGEMQGADYEGLLARIFQQAQGAIPGLQAAYSNAIGARSGNNSAVAAALQELLKSTTIEAQNNLVSQTLQNQNIRQAAGGNIAQATQGTRQTTQANTMTGSPMGDLAALFAVLKGAQTLTGSKNVQEMIGKMSGIQTSQPAPATAPVRDANVQPVSQAPISSAPMAPSAALFTPVPGGAFSVNEVLTPTFNPTPMESRAQASFMPGYQPFDINQLVTNAPSASFTPAPWNPPAFNINDYLVPQTYNQWTSTGSSGFGPSW
jgi:hypothetical protein